MITKTFICANLPEIMSQQGNKRKLYDFQTPYSLALDITKLQKSYGLNPDVIIEPTHGSGNFMIAAGKVFPHAKIIGVELEKKYHETTLNRIQQIFPNYKKRFTLIHGSIFSQNLIPDDANSILILGSPPLSGGYNNSKQNLNVTYAILNFILSQSDGSETNIALLNRIKINKQLLKDADRKKWRITKWQMRLFPRRMFPVADIGLMEIKFSEGEQNRFCKHVAYSKGVTHPLLGKISGWVKVGRKQKFVSDYISYRNVSHLDSYYSSKWRYGLSLLSKKEAVLTKVESYSETSLFQNYNHDIYEIEDEVTYPFIHNIRNRVDKHDYIVLDKGEEKFATRFPLAWKYLSENNLLDENINRNSLKLRIGGVNSYSLKPYKIAITSSKKNPKFVLLGPREGKPVILGHDIAFLSFTDLKEAEKVFKTLTSDQVIELLKSIVYPTEKKPYSVSVLNRIPTNLERVSDTGTN